MRQKPIIYQLLPRLFSNFNEHCLPAGTIEQNGSGKLNAINASTLKAIHSMGVTHVWYTGVIEHAHCADYSAYGIAPHNHHVIKGQAGSPYAITDYYDIDPDLAEDVDNRMEEFEALVARTHAAGMKAIIDFVPNHVARQYHSDAAPKGAPSDFGEGDDCEKFFARDNNFYYITHQLFSPSIDLGTGREAYVEFPAKASGNDCFTAFPGQYDWYDTVKLNYGVDYGDGTRHFTPTPDTWMKMLHILLYWAGKGVDGFRCDMVHMVPLEFWQWAIPKVKADYPGVIFIAEIYDVNLYHPYITVGGFDYLYDKVNLYDTLRAIQTANHSAARITDCWQRLGDMSQHMLNFLENHDEQRFASPFYAGNAELVTPSLIVSATMSTGAMMIYAGQELGEKAADAEGYSGIDGRTTIFDYWSIPTLRRWLCGGSPSTRHLTTAEKQLRQLYITTLKLCNTEPAIACGQFYDLMWVNYQNPAFDPHRQFAYLRHFENQTILIAVNFDAVEKDIEINIPEHAFEFLGIKSSAAVETTDLLTGTKVTRSMSAEKPFTTHIKGYGAVMWKWTEKSAHPSRCGNKSKPNE